jgi:WD40 repeat protein
MVWAEEDSHLQAWDIQASHQLPLHAPRMLQGWHGLAFLPDGQSIIYVSESGIAEIWDVKKDRRVKSIGAAGTFIAPHVALSPDGKWFAALTQHDMVSVWRLTSGKHLFSLPLEADSVWSLAWDASGNRLAVGQSNGAIAVVHLQRIQRKLADADLQWQEDD